MIFFRFGKQPPSQPSAARRRGDWEAASAPLAADAAGDEERDIHEQLTELQRKKSQYENVMRQLQLMRSTLVAAAGSKTR